MKPLFSALRNSIARPIARLAKKRRFKKSAAEFMAAFGDYFTETLNDKPLPPLPVDPVVAKICENSPLKAKPNVYQVGDSDFFEVVEASGEALAVTLAA